MKITMLGCGSSSGVPIIGCDCAVCTSANPKNKRTRVSVLVETGELTLMIDSSPDLREQALRHNIKHIDAVLYTHDHADHVNGLDDLRSFNYLANAPLPVYSHQEAMDKIQQRFPYAFLPKPEHIWYRPCLTPNILPSDQVFEFKIKNTTITALRQTHGRIESLGFRIGNFAYSTDVNLLEEEAFKALEGIDTWVVDCLRYRESPSHSHLVQTLEWIARVKPRLAVLTHMAHDFDYDTLRAELPPGIVPGYDGMVIDL